MTVIDNARVRRAIATTKMVAEHLGWYHESGPAFPVYQARAKIPIIYPKDFGFVLARHPTLPTPANDN